MASKERLELIKQHIQSLKKVSVSELSKQFSVTEETIRRDLDKLEAEGAVTRIHGGAIWNADAPKEGIHFYERREKNLAKKQQIAWKAVPLLKGKRTVIADSSSTVMEVLKLIPEDEEHTIVTNSTEAFLEFQQKAVSVISTGGEFNKRSVSLQGQLAISTVEKYHVNIALISCKGLNLESGVSDSNENEAEVKKAMLRSADQVVLLADSSKFNQSGFVFLMDWDRVDYLVTDQCPEWEWVIFCRENNIKLIY
jgi:DeoR/GlpR family transcriptional regulator of sugar metabolism